MTKQTAPARFKLILEYDGSRYSGWQKQDDARTIQGSLLHAAAMVLGSEAVDIQGSGRTDAGVHALRYAAHLEARTNLAPDAIQDALNEALPADIGVLGVERVDPRFHARHHCVARSYVYRIAQRKTVFNRKYVWWVPESLDVAAMRRAAGLMVGMHDFIAFAERQELKKSTLVLVRVAEVIEEDDQIVFRIIGSHFLWKMVRRIVAILVEVGRHKLSEDDVLRFLASRPDRPLRYLAPPAGLFFEQAFYHEQELQEFLRQR